MKYTVLLIALFLLSNCGKKTTINGRVYNPVTNEGIAGIEVYVTRPKGGLGYDGNGTKTVYTTITDASGNFVIDERFRKSKSYTISYGYDQKKYKLFDKQNSPAGAEYDGSLIEFPLIPLGKLTENINNISCFNSSDIISLEYFHRSIPNHYEGFNPVEYTGCFSHYGDENNVPMGWYVCIGTVTKNGITTPFADSIYVTEGGDHIWDIEY